MDSTTVVDYPLAVIKCENSVCDAIDTKKQLMYLISSPYYHRVLPCIRCVIAVLASACID